MNKRLSRAFRAAAAVWFSVALAGCFILLARWQSLSTEPISSISVVVALTAIVFLTYFLLGLAGYRVSLDRHARVHVPRVVGWLVVAVTTVITFGVLFYFLIRW
jgi:uncharacterized membrane protein YozB (DUF420 family)